MDYASQLEQVWLEIHVLYKILNVGSTSWIFNINKLTHHAVESLLKITFETTRFPLNWKVNWPMNIYNVQNLIVGPEIG